MELFDEEGICYTYNSGNCLKTITDSKGNLVASEELGENASIDKTSVEDYHYYHLNEHEDVEYITGNYKWQNYCQLQIPDIPSR